MGEVTPEVLDKMLKAYTVWREKFGEERAIEIGKKVASPKWISENSVLDLIRVGDKWHFANLLLQGKISNEEFRKSFK